MNRYLMCVVFGLATLTISTQASADILFQNPSDYGGPTGYDAFPSQLPLPIGSSNQILYSEFSLSSSSPVGSIEWQGAYVNEFASPAPSPTAIGFNFYLFQGDATAPNLGQLLYANFIATGTGTPGFVQETFNSKDAGFILVNGAQTTAAIYDYSVSIPGQVLPLNTALWLSIVAVTPNDLGSPDWAWISGGSASGLGTYFDFNGGGLGVASSRDRTFTLRGVPEPSSLALAGLGIGILFVRRLKARRTGPPKAE
jgi:hypothetical protein